MAKQFVCRVGEIPVNTMKECEAEGGLKLLVANARDEFFAYQAICPHQDVPLCEGLYDGAMLTCHMHLWQWDIRSGAVTGGLMAYGTPALERWHRAATYVAKILKGANPGDLPMEQPMKFELVLNLKTAQALGLTIPATLLFLADEVIQ